MFHWAFVNLNRSTPPPGEAPKPAGESPLLGFLTPINFFEGRRRKSLAEQSEVDLGPFGYALFVKQGDVKGEFLDDACELQLVPLEVDDRQEHRSTTLGLAGNGPLVDVENAVEH